MKYCKIIPPILLAAVILMQVACIRSLEDEGIYEDIICRGKVLEEQSQQPVGGMSVRILQGDKTLSVVATESDGRFEIPISLLDLSKGCALQLCGDSLYVGTQIKIDPKAYGQQYYDVGTIYVSRPSISIVHTDSIYDITSTSVKCGFSIINDGGRPILDAGVCWAILPSPTIANSHTNGINEMGTYTSVVSGLQPNTTYYLRSYVTTIVGTSYGETLQFTTLNGLAEVITGDVINITGTSAQCVSEVVSDGGFIVTARGICYSTSPNPTTASSHTTDGSGTGSFTSHLVNLSSNTLYYIRAYATNATGTTYGINRSFRTE